MVKVNHQPIMIHLLDGAIPKLQMKHAVTLFVFAFRSKRNGVRCSNGCLYGPDFMADNRCIQETNMLRGQLFDKSRGKIMLPLTMHPTIGRKGYIHIFFGSGDRKSTR